MATRYFVTKTLKCNIKRTNSNHYQLVFDLIVMQSLEVPAVILLARAVVRPAAQWPNQPCHHVPLHECNFYFLVSFSYVKPCHNWEQSANYLYITLACSLHEHMLCFLCMHQLVCLQERNRWSWLGTCKASQWPLPTDRHSVLWGTTYMAHFKSWWRWSDSREGFHWMNVTSFVYI